MNRGRGGLTLRPLFFRTGPLPLPILPYMKNNIDNS